MWGRRKHKSDLAVRPKVTWHVPEGTEDVLVPKRATMGALAFDLVSPAKEVVPAGGKVIINSLLAVTLPEGYGLIVKERSGMAFKHGVVTGAGWIDEDYRGLIKVVLFNHSDKDYAIDTYDRFAQVRLVKKYDIDVGVSYEYPDPNETARGAGGFGSTGK